MIKCDVKINIIDPNSKGQVEEALSEMIAYQLAVKKIKEIGQDY